MAIQLPENITQLSKKRTEEWLLYHKYILFKLRNDIDFHKSRVNELKDHLRNLRIKIPRLPATIPIQDVNQG